MLVNRLVFTAAIFVWLRSIAPWLRLGWSFCSLKEIKHLAHPSMSYMFIPIGTALLIQGPVVILGLISARRKLLYSRLRVRSQARNIDNEYDEFFGYS